MKMLGTVNEVLRQKGSAVYAIAPDATVFDAIALMAERNVGSLVVLDDGRLVGVVTERDYTRRVVLEGRTSRETLVRDIVREDPVTVTAQYEIMECMELMTARRVRHLPVVDGKRVVGVVSVGDLVNFIISVQDQTIQQLENYVQGTYPA